MFWTFERHSSPDFIRVVTRGAFTASKFGEMFDELFQYEAWEPRIPILFDQRKVVYSKMVVPELLAASNTLISKNPKLAYTKIAILLDTPESFTMAERFSEATLSSSAAFMEIFMDEEKAKNWLFARGVAAP